MLRSMAVIRPQGGLITGSLALSWKNVHGAIRRSSPGATPSASPSGLSPSYGLSFR